MTIYVRSSQRAGPAKDTAQGGRDVNNPSTQDPRPVYPAVAGVFVWGVLGLNQGLHLCHLAGLLCFWQIQYPDHELADHAMIYTNRPAVKHKPCGREVGHCLTPDLSSSPYGVLHRLPYRCPAEPR